MFRQNKREHRTRCVSTFSGHTCECGVGFRAEVGEDGGEVCADVNECAEDPAQCACERCACHNEPGSHTCERDLPQPCTAEGGWAGCWSEEIDGKVHHACVDNIAAYQCVVDPFHFAT